MSCKIIQGNQWHLDGGVMFGNAPKTLWNRWVECDDLNRITMASNCLLIQEDNLTVLVDTGISPFMDPKIAHRYAIEGESSALLENLKQDAVSEEDVDYVLLTHLHFDHMSGLIPPWPAITDPESKPYFPSAKYLVNKRQYDRARAPHPRDRASYFAEIMAKIEDSGRIVLLEDGEVPPELSSFLSIEISNGHTPGLMMPIIKTNGETIFFPSDLISGAPWVHLPIVTGLERKAEDLINEQKSYLDRAIAENWLVVFDHDAVTKSAHIKFNEENMRYEASID